jgi:hypothetical protein
MKENKLTQDPGNNKHETEASHISTIPALKFPAGPFPLRKPKKTEMPPGTTLTGMYFMYVSIVFQFVLAIAGA